MLLKRILHISGKMNMGGQETLIMNIYRNIDRSKIQFDFVIHTEEKCFYDDEIEKLGGKIYRIPRIIHPIKHCKALAKILKENKYEVMHRHTCSAIVFLDLLIAKWCKVKTRIVHSHAQHIDSKFGKLHKLFIPLLNKYSNVKYACSENAGKWLYGSKNKKFTVIYNGIDIDKFAFNEYIRKKIRDEFNIPENTKVYGNVGRFSEIKNHSFLFDVFKEIINKEPNSLLLLCGDGELRISLEKKAKELNIYDKIIFAGVRKDVYNFYQAMDTFIFTSLKEGAPLVLVEAQIAGLPCFFKDNAIPSLARVSDKLYAFSENDDAKVWADKILSANINSSRKIDKKIFEKFDINYTTSQVLKDYLK